MTMRLSSSYEAPGVTARQLIRDAAIDLHHRGQSHGIDFEYADQRLDELADALDSIDCHAAADDVMTVRSDVEDRTIDPDVASSQLDVIADRWS